MFLPSVSILVVLLGSIRTSFSGGSCTVKIVDKNCRSPDERFFLESATEVSFSDDDVTITVSAEVSLVDTGVVEVVVDIVDVIVDVTSGVPSLLGVVPLFSSVFGPEQLF